MSRALAIGLVQGLTEFIPVSSSGHLLALPYLLDMPAPSLSVIVLAHIGTLCAVLVAYRRRIFFFFREKKTGVAYLGFLVLGTLPAAILGVLLENRIEEAFAQPKILPLFFLITAALLFLYDRRHFKEERLTPAKAFYIGLWQSIALLPGISRMGTTLYASQASGLSFEQSIEFSFLLSVLAIAGSALLESKEILALPAQTATMVFSVSFAAGLFAIALLRQLAAIKKLSFFSFYLLFLSTAIWIK